MKRLIVNADDFGLSPEVNAGIIRAHRDGILGGASLMVAELAAKPAAESARHNPRLDVGLHAVVCKGRSVLDAAQLRGAVGLSGKFIDNPPLMGRTALLLRLDRMRSKMTRRNSRAQSRTAISKLVGYLNHIDGHLNFHVHPLFADIPDCASRGRIQQCPAFVFRAST